MNKKSDVTNLEVFVKSDVNIPMRLWELALGMNDWHSRMYNQKGFVYSQDLTRKYNTWSDEDKKMIQFTYIYGIKQGE